MVGIKDIAKKAGVSISTVSYALNGSSKVTEETRTRIQAIAEELNYVPNMAARTLKRRQTNIIGVYLADYGGSFYGELLEGIKKGLALFDYEMIVCSGKKSHLFIPEKMVDGAIILDLIEPLNIGISGKFSWIIVAVPRRQLSNLSMWVQKKFFCFLDQKKVMIAKNDWLLVHEN